MLNTPAILQSELDALNLTQMINEPTRYNPKYVNTGTLIDIILTTLPSKYTSAVFNQDLSDQGQATTPHHCQTLPKTLQQAGLSNRPGQDIDLIPSVKDAWLFFKSAFLTILNKHLKKIEPGTDIALGSLQT